MSMKRLNICSTLSENVQRCMYKRKDKKFQMNFYISLKGLEIST